MVLLESRIFKFLYNKVQVFFGRPDKIDDFEMGQFFGHFIYFLNEIDVIFVKFGLRIDDGDDPGSLPI
jgi:hypothetical protein